MKRLHHRHIFLLLAVIWLWLMPTAAVFGRSFLVTSNSDFATAGAQLFSVLASDTQGNPAAYLRLRNTNPGFDDGTPALKFTGGGARLWTRKRSIQLTIPTDMGTDSVSLGQADRSGEKVQLDLSTLGGAQSDWGDLRLINWASQTTNFRLLNYETPVDNPSTLVRLLFHATATVRFPAASNTYWLFYGNIDGTSVATSTISPFYLTNHDFENGLNNWRICPAAVNQGVVGGLAALGNAPDATFPLMSLEDNMSLVPSGFVGYDNKSSLSVGFPESTVYPNRVWRAYSQQISGPATGTYVLRAYRKFVSASYTKSWYSLLMLQNAVNGSNQRYFITAGISDWDNISVEHVIYRNVGFPAATTTIEAGLGMWNNSGGSASIRERRCNFDWAVLELKYPLNVTLGPEQMAGYAASATYISKVFDTGAVVGTPIWGPITWLANTTAAGTSIQFFTRSGASSAACQAAAWDTVTGNGATVPSTPLRYVQFMALLKTSDTGVTPILDEVELFYTLPTTQLQVLASSTVIPGEFFTFAVTAVDQNLTTVTDFAGLVQLQAGSPTVTLPVTSYVFTSSDRGIATFTARQVASGQFTIVASWSNTLYPSNLINARAVKTEQLKVILPGTVTAGSPVSGWLKGCDRYGNVNPSDNNVLSFACGDTHLLASFPIAPRLVGGLFTLNNVIFRTTPQQTVVVKDDSRGLATTTTITVIPGATDSFRLTALPDQYQGVPFSLRVELIDSSGNVVPLTQAFTLNVSSGTISPAGGTVINGSATLIASLTALGNLTLSVPQSATPNPISVYVHPAPPAQLDRFQVDAGYLQLAGVPFTLNIEARDIFDNVMPSYQGACRLRIMPPPIGTATPLFTTGYTFLDGVLAMPVTLSVASDNVNLRVEDIQDPSKFGQVTLKVLPGGLDHFEMIAPASVIAGASVTFTLKARDSMGNLITNYTGTVLLSHNAHGGTPWLPSVYPFTLGDAGIHLFSGPWAGLFTLAEPVQLIAEDTGRTGSATVIITPDAASLTIVVSPDQNRFTVDLKRPMTFSVEVKDRFENPMAGYAGTVNLGYTGTPVIGPANYTFQSFEDGHHVFLNSLTPQQLGTYRIWATETVTLAGGNTASITVSSGKTKDFSFDPASVIATAGLFFPFTLTARDPDNNANQEYSGSVRFTATDAAALLPYDSTLTNGVGTFTTTTFRSAGIYRLTARDSLDPSITGSMTVVVNASQPNRMQFEFFQASTTAGVPFSFSLHLLDPSGNHASYTGPITISASDPFTAPLLINFTNQSVVTNLWACASAGAQRLLATSPAFANTLSDPMLVNADVAASITGRFPRSVSSEMIVPFLVQVVDQYRNPTSRFTDQITVTSPGTGFSPTETAYSFSSRDNGEHLFYARWDYAAVAPSTTTITFNDNPATSIPAGGSPLTLNVYVDNPSVAGVTYPFMVCWLSNPDRNVVASQPFKLILRMMSIRDNAASTSMPIDFSVNNGDILVSRDGITYGRSITLTNESVVPLWAVVTRTGYLSVMATPRTEPLKAGTVSFVVQPGPLDSVTITADSPQYAGATFPWKTEWWDGQRNYAENAIGPITFAASAVGAVNLDPGNILVSGRGGVLDLKNNTRWFESKFWISSATSNIRNDLVLNQISLQGSFDEDFTDGALGGFWQWQNFGGAGGSVGSHSLTDNQLSISTIGTGTLLNVSAPSTTAANAAYWQQNINDGYYYLYFNWPVNDVFPFDARMFVKRLHYDATQHLNPSLIGLMMRDDSSTQQPRYVCTQLHNIDGGHPANTTFNMLFFAQFTYRNTAAGLTYRQKVSQDPSTGTTHPKWLRLQGSRIGAFTSTYSPDGASWLSLNQSNPANPVASPAFNAATTKLGICVSGGQGTVPAVANYLGQAWITEFRLNRYPQNGSFTSVVYDTGVATSVTYTNPMTVTAVRTGGANQTEVRLFARASNNSSTISTQPWTPLALAWAGKQGTANPSGFNGLRYFQYALTLDARVAGTNGGITYYDDTPIVEEVLIPYTAPGGTKGGNFSLRNIDPSAVLFASYTAAASVAQPIQIKGGQVSRLAITVPEPPVATAGVPFTVTVSAQDNNGNVADDASGTWSFSSNDGLPYKAVVPGNYTLVPLADKGQHTFSNAAILYNPIQSGMASVSVTDGTLASWGGLTVRPGPLYRFVGSCSTPQIASSAFPVLVKAEDAYENTKDDYAGNTAFSDTRTGGNALYQPTGLGPASWAGGFATLTPGVSFTKAETLKILMTGDNRAGETNVVQIIGATTTRLLLAVAPSNQPKAGTPFDLRLTALDDFGNVAATYSGQISFSCNDSGAGVILPATYTFLPADAGIHSWPGGVTLMSPGLVTLHIRDVVNATMTCDYPLTVLPGDVARFELSCAPIQTVNVPFNLLITALDNFGHVKTDFSNKVTMTSSFTSILPTTVSGFSNGQLLVPSTELFNGVLPKSGYIIASYGTAMGSTAVTLGAPSSLFDHYALEAIPATPTAGDAFKLVVKAVGATGTIFISYNPSSIASLTASNSLGLSVTPALTPVAATGFLTGVKEVYAKVWEAGQITIWAREVGSTKVGSLTLNILPSNLAYFELEPGTSTAEVDPNHYNQIVNATFPLTITGYDTIGNVKSTYDGTVQLTHNGTGTLSLSSAILSGGSGTVNIKYNQPGKIKITAKDPLLLKSGVSSNIGFYGKLASFVVECGYDQTDEAPFPAKLTAMDEFGQVKPIVGASVTAIVAAWGGGGSAVLSPTGFTPTWTDGIAYVALTASITPDAQADHLMTVRFAKNPVGAGSASGSANIFVHRKSVGVATKFLLEAFSPQKAGVPFPFMLKAVDNTNSVVTGWTPENSTLTATTTFIPGFVASTSFAAGVYSTTGALFDRSGTYRLSASSTALVGSTTIIVSPGPLAAIRLRVPNSAPLNTPFTLAVEGLTADGSVKSDYIPDGQVRLKLNATATGFLGIDTIDPIEFVGGIATLTTETYNKSQLIWLTVKDPLTSIATTAGPISVYGVPAKFYLEPQSAPLYWNNFFLIKVTVKDANGFIVPDYDSTIHFSALPGTAPTATSPYVVPSLIDQHFSSFNAGVGMMTLKVGYATDSLPISIWLRINASDTAFALSKTTGDLEFIFDPLNPLFDHWEITSPLPNQKRQKKIRFAMDIRAVSNLGTSMVVTQAPTVVASVIDSSVPITGFNASPTSLLFTAESATFSMAIADYTEAATATVRWTVDPFGLGVASVPIDLILEEPRVRTDLINVLPNSRYILSLYAQTKDRTLATGTGAIEVACYGLADPASYTHLATLSGPSGPAGILVKTSGNHEWKRYYWWFDTAANTASISVRLSSDEGVVYFDGLMIEPAIQPGQTEPTVYSPYPVGIIHTASDGTIDLSGSKYYWQW